MCGLIPSYQPQAKFVHHHHFLAIQHSFKPEILRGSRQDASHVHLGCQWQASLYSQKSEYFSSFEQRKQRTNYSPRSKPERSPSQRIQLDSVLTINIQGIGSHLRKGDSFKRLEDDGADQLVFRYGLLLTQLSE